MPQIEVSDQTFEALQQLARPLLDTADSVIQRLLGDRQAKTADTPSISADLLATQSRNYTHRRPVSYEFAGKNTPVSTFKEVYLGLCGDMLRLHGNSFSQVLTLRGRQRKFFSESSESMTHPQLIPSTAIYAETNFSAENMVDRCHDLLQLFGHSPGDLRIQVRPDNTRPAGNPTHSDRQEKLSMTWVDAIRTALRSLGGKASLFQLYRVVPELRGGSTPDTYDAIIRGTLETYSSDSRNFRPGNPDYFYSVGGIGSGEWGLREWAYSPSNTANNLSNTSSTTSPGAPATNAISRSR